MQTICEDTCATSEQMGCISARSPSVIVHHSNCAVTELGERKTQPGQMTVVSGFGNFRPHNDEGIDKGSDSRRFPQHLGAC